MNEMQAAGLGLGIVLGLIVVLLLISSLFMHIGTALAKIEPRSFLKAIGATILTSIVGTLLGLIPILGFIASLFINPLIVMSLYSSTYGQAFLAYIISIVIPIILALVLVFGGGLAALGMAS